jgi:2,3-bisphosphoglycerate-dependent phosphoglycerate mutase
MRVILIRHGQSSNNVLADLEMKDFDHYMETRSPEPPLTELGVKQAELLGSQFALAAEAALPESERISWVGREHPISALYVSPMLRALQTARPMSKLLKLEPRVWVDIHEHGGVFSGNPFAGKAKRHPGLSRSKIAELFPDYVVSEQVTEAGWWMGLYEPDEACFVRAQKVAGELLRMAIAQPNDTIALVTHGTFLDNLLHALLMPGREYDECVHFSHLNTAVSRVDVGETGHVAVRYLNRVDHLPLGLASR